MVRLRIELLTDWFENLQASDEFVCRSNVLHFQRLEHLVQNDSMLRLDVEAG
jgi:hypothetical protein